MFGWELRGGGSERKEYGQINVRGGSADYGTWCGGGGRRKED